MLEDSHPLSMTCKPKGKETEDGKKFLYGIKDKIIKENHTFKIPLQNLRTSSVKRRKRNTGKKAKPEFCCFSATFVRRLFGENQSLLC